MKKIWTKMLTTALAVCMTLSVAFAGNAYAAEETDTLQATMDYLVNECGPRLAATPNEDKAAAYIKAQFESFGYTDVEWAKPVKNGGYTGKLTFSDGSADIYGNCYPNNPTNGAFDKIVAPLVDLGTDSAYAIPEGITGDIIGAVKFSGSITADAVTAILEKLAADNPEVTIKGLLLAKADTITVPRISNMNSFATPCVVTTDYLYTKALAQADKLASVERYELAKTNAVIATKEAATDDPDAIIIVTAHMDSVIAAPGASDNATGSAALVELAKIFSTVDNGNIKLIFASVGSEESGGMLGTQYVISTLTAEEKAIAINLNMDMLGAIQPDGDGDPLNAVSMDIYCGRGSSAKALTLNLPAYLVTNGAKNITWAEGIDNVRIYKYGSSDHQKFQEAGIDAASMIVVTNEDDDIESINHTSADTLENNYSYDRLKMCTALMANGIQTAIDKQLSKKAQVLFLQNKEEWFIQLFNAEQLFQLYDAVTVTMTEILPEDDAAEGEEAPVPSTVELIFTADVPAGALGFDPADYEITSVVATGSGVADNLDAERNEQLKNFAADLVCQAETMTVEEFTVGMIDLLEQLPASEKKLAAPAIRELYEALDDEQKTLVSNYDKLVAAEKAVEAYDVEVMIDGLTGELDKDTVLAVKEAYDALDDEQKALVPNFAQLEAAVKAISAPATGDTFHTALFIGMMTVSVMAAAALVLQTKKQKI